MSKDSSTQITRPISQVISRSSAPRAFAMKHRMLVLALGASVLVLAAIGAVTTSGLINQDSQKATTHVKHAEGSSVTTMTTTNTPPIDGLSGSPDTKTHVIVNDKPIDVPKNGSVSRTFTNDNGTTRVDVSSNTSTNGSSVSSSVRTNNTSKSTNTYSQDVNIKSSP